MIKLSATQRRKFLENVVVDPVTKCWLWQNHLVRGYGQILFEGIRHYAHRLAYRIFKGGVPAGIRVLHKCDTTNCVNPKHLFLGTQKDNSDDMMRKGRGPCGERHSSAKLREIDIPTIRASNSTNSELADYYGVLAWLIGAVKRHIRWKHIS